MRYIILIIASSVVVLHGCGGDELTAKRQELANAEKQLEKWKKEVRELEQEIEQLDPDTTLPNRKLVTVLPVELQTFNHFIEIQGTAQSEDNIVVSTDMGGLTTQILVDEGQSASRGQTLVQLDNSVVLDNIEELKTALDLANTVFAKQERLWSQKIGSEIQYLEAKNNKESLERKLQTAYTQLEKTKIKSPINGVIDEVFVKLGQLAGPGAPVIRVVNNSNIEIEANVSEAHLGVVSRGDQVTVYFPALELERKAVVKSVGQVINPNNRTFKILLSISNKDRVLKPNLLATIKINDYTKESAVIIPTRLIHYARGEEFVYTVQQNGEGIDVAQKIIVQSGKTYKGNTEIIAGLTPEQVLINDGYRDVTPGEHLRIHKNGKN